MTDTIIPGLGPTSQFQLEEYSVSYENGSTLSFFEIPNSTYAQPSYQLEQWVQVSFANSGGQMYFRGKIKEREHYGKNNQEAIRYNVWGIQRLANEFYVKDPFTGRSRMFLNPVSTVTGHQNFQSFYTTVLTSPNPISFPIVETDNQNLQQAIAYYFGLNYTLLNSEGIPANYDLSTVPNTVTLPGTVTIEGPFYAGLDKLASIAPGGRMLFDDCKQVWKYVDVSNSPIMQISIDNINVMEHNVKWNTSGRYTAINLFAKRRASTLGNIFKNVNAYQYTLPVLPAWDLTLEADWTRLKGATEVVTVTAQNISSVQSLTANPAGFMDNNYVQPGDVLYNAYYHVYRTYIVGMNAYYPIKGEAIFRYQTMVSTTIVSSGVNDISYISPDGNYVSVKAKAVLSPLVGVFTGYSGVGGIYLITEDPVIIGGNPDFPGMARGPNYIGKNDLTSQQIFQNNFNGMLGTFEIESPPFVVLGLNADIVRYPQVGYTGNMFTFFGLRRERTVEVEPEALSIGNAELHLRLYKDAIVSGEIPIEGSLLPQLVSLGKKLQLTHSLRATALASITSYLTGYRYQFGKRGTSYLSFTTDQANFIRWST